jgi:hypothetical protein
VIVHVSTEGESSDLQTVHQLTVEYPSKAKGDGTKSKNFTYPSVYVGAVLCTVLSKGKQESKIQKHTEQWPVGEAGIEPSNSPRVANVTHC